MVRISGDHLAGVDTDSHRQTGADRALDLEAQVCDCLAQFDGGAKRSHSVVLVQDGDSEDGHDRVADELLDGPPVALQNSRRRLVVPGHHVPQLLRVVPLSDARRVDDVAEEDGDCLTNLGPSTFGCNSFESGTARVAEPRVLRIAGAAAGTCGHVAKLYGSSTRYATLRCRPSIGGG